MTKTKTMKIHWACSYFWWDQEKLVITLDKGKIKNIKIVVATTCLAVQIIFFNERYSSFANDVAYLRRFSQKRTVYSEVPLSKKHSIFLFFLK